MALLSVSIFLEIFRHLFVCQVQKIDDFSGTVLESFEVVTLKLDDPRVADSVRLIWKISLDSDNGRCCNCDILNDQQSKAY